MKLLKKYSILNIVLDNSNAMNFQMVLFLKVENLIIQVIKRLT